MRIANKTGDVRITYILGDCDSPDSLMIYVIEIEDGEEHNFQGFTILEEFDNLINPGIFRVKKSKLQQFIKGKYSAMPITLYEQRQ